MLLRNRKDDNPVSFSLDDEDNADVESTGDASGGKSNDKKKPSKSYLVNGSRGVVIGFVEPNLMSNGGGGFLLLLITQFLTLFCFYFINFNFYAFSL